jgi:alkylhydroperoxidase family enzyme
MHLLNAWREAPAFSERERAALAWVEALTLITEGHVPDEVYEKARRIFSEKELVDLTAATIAINGWNRVCIAFRATPQVKGAQAAA